MILSSTVYELQLMPARLLGSLHFLNFLIGEVPKDYCGSFYAF
jgi:hypothetical protein